MCIYIYTLYIYIYIYIFKYQQFLQQFFQPNKIHLKPVQPLIFPDTHEIFFQHSIGSCLGMVFNLLVGEGIELFGEGIELLLFGWKKSGVKQKTS